MTRIAPLLGGGALGGFVEHCFITAGKLGLDRKVAQQQLALAGEKLTRERQRLLNSVRSLYHQALGDQLLIGVRSDLAGLAAHAVAVSCELANFGQADCPDLLAAETEAERFELELVNAQNVRDRIWRQRSALVNNPELKPLTLAGSLEDIPKFDAVQALETIYRESPELRAAEVLVRQTEYSVPRAAVEKIPDIFVRGGAKQP